MTTGLRKKRARSDDGADDSLGGVASEGVLVTTSNNTAGAATKRRRVAAAGAAASSPSGRQKENSAASAVAATATPQTPRTLHAVTSAITGALKRGGLAPRMFAVLLPERRTNNELEKLYDVDAMLDGDHPADEAAEDAAEKAGTNDDDDDELLVATPTKPRSHRSQKLTAQVAKSLRFTPQTPRTQQRAMPRTSVQESDDELGDREAGGEDEDERTPRKTMATTATTTPTSVRRRMRDPFGNLAIDGTDRLKSGLTLDLTRGARHRTTPAKYREGVESVRGSGTPLGTSPRAKRTATERPEKAKTVKLEKSRSSAHAATKQRPEAPRVQTATPTKPRGRQARAAPEPEPELELALAAGAEKEEAAEEEEDEEDDDDDDDDDDEVCVLCGKPDSEPPNEIVFCERCDMAVHQLCYNVPAIPEGDWFCKVCVTEGEKKAKEDKEAHARRDAAEEDAMPVVTSSDLAPDIPNFARHLARTKQLLMRRCTGRQRVPLHGQDEAYDKTYQLVEQTVVAGEGNSMLVIGARGTGKSTMVESVLHVLAAAHKGTFHVVRLNGFIHTDDKLALRAIWRQLGKEMAVEDDVVSKTNNYADTMASLLALLSHPSEMAAEAAAGPAVAEAATTLTSTSVVFILDEFDLFATHARQTLLYNLLDIAQARKAPIAVLGLTTRVDVVETLEKRVKSRFSHRYVYLSLPRSLPAYWDVCRLGLVVEEEDESTATTTDPMAMDEDTAEGAAVFRAWWRHMVDSVHDEPAFQAQLAFHFYSSKSVAAFWTACLVALAAVSPAAPRLRLPPVGSTLGVAAAPRLDAATTGGPPPLPLSLVAPDSKLHLLAALSELELALLVAAARLDIVLSTDTVNFAMAYDEYVALMGRHHLAASASGSALVAGGSRVWGRGVATRAWERLAALGLLIPAGNNSTNGGGGTNGGGTGVARRGRGRPPGDGAAGGSGLEGRSMWRTEVALEEIPAAPGVRLGAVLARWCKEI